jgi:tetratricopeptide (TPR) repeat protein
LYSVIFDSRIINRKLNNTIFDKIIADIESGNFRNAIQYCDELLNKYPDNRGVFEIRSGCYYALGDYDSAISDLTYSIVKVKSGDDTREEIIGLYSKRGKIYLKQGDWKKASEDYKKIIMFNEDLPEIQNSLALCYRKMENYTDAHYHATQAIKLKNDYAEAYNNRANINISLENYTEAIDDYTRSIGHNPLSANVYFNRGSIYYDILNDKDSAIKDFLEAISINPIFKEELVSHYPELINRRLKKIKE